MITAICYDECGTEVSIEIDNLDEIPPEYKFRYSQSIPSESWQSGGYLCKMIVMITIMEMIIINRRLNKCIHTV